MFEFKFIADGLEKVFESGQKTAEKAEKFRQLSDKELKEKLRSSTSNYTDKITATTLLLERGYGRSKKR